MRIAIVISMLFVFLLTACSDVTTSRELENTESSYGFSISHSIDEYSLTMSSVPGFPLEITCNGVSEGNQSLVAECIDGSFLIWHGDGTIENIGKTFNGEFNDITLYWSPINDKDQSVLNTTSFSLGIYNKENEKTTNKVEGEFIIADNKNYAIRFK